MNEKFSPKARQIMDERFGRDTLIALATVDGNIPNVRTVNAITYALSNKMKQIAQNPNVGICGEWFTAHGKGTNMGWFCKEDNKVIAQKLREVFCEWIDNGHNDFNDENTIILRVELTDGLLLSHGTRYEF